MSHQTPLLAPTISLKTSVLTVKNMKVRPKNHLVLSRPFGNFAESLELLQYTEKPGDKGAAFGHCANGTLISRVVHIAEH
jgi:hypothetical protein